MKQILTIALLMLSIKTQCQTTKVVCISQNSLSKLVIDNPDIRAYVAPNGMVLVVVDSIRAYKWKMDTTKIISITNDSLNRFLFVEK